MTTASEISEREYLASAYEPDCDYVEGRLVERNVGEYDHSRFQILLGGLFLRLEERHGGRVLVEQRCRVAPGRYRIPDVCMMRPGAARERVLTSPPLLVVEILSPEDRLTAQLERLEDYRAWGVAHIWLADPVRQKVYEFARALQEVESQALAAEGLTVDFGALFRELAKE